MRRRFAVTGLFALLLVWASIAQKPGPEAIEVLAANAADLLPKGKEAEGIPGDFVLRNNRIHVLISGTQPLRRANMRTENAFVTQGAIYDLDLRNENNDQLTAFRPGNLGGELSWVRVVEGTPRNAAAIEAVRTAAKGDGLYTRHEYRVEQDWQHLLISSTYRNEGKQPRKITPRPQWRGFEDSTEWQVGSIQVANAIDPFDKRAYAWSAVPSKPGLPEQVDLAPGEERSYSVFLAVAGSPVAAYGVLATLRGQTGEVKGAAAGPDGAPAVHGTLHVPIDGVTLPHYPDARGNLSFRLPPGSYALRFDDLGRDVVQQQVQVRNGTPTSLNLNLGPASAAQVRIRDERGAPTPGRVQFIGLDGTPTPDLGPSIRAHGSDHQYQVHDGQFTQQLPPGRYLLRFTRGPEFDLEEKTIDVTKGATVSVEATLRRTVDTAGWVSTDFHSHSSPSGDNYCATDDRLINLVAEHIEFAPATEHNRIYDWQPHIDRLQLNSYLKSIVGLELTGSGDHLNAFPLKADPYAQDGGAPVYNYDPRINALVLRNWGTPSQFPGASRHDTYQTARVGAPHFAGGPDRWVQINHPSVGTAFFDRNRDGVNDGGFVGLESLLDAAEVWSADILQGPYIERAGRGAATAPSRRSPNRTFGWLQMLNQGRHIWCVAVSDAHRIFGGGVGGWRTYVPSSHDDPAKIDPMEIIRNAKAGRMMITNGPFLEVTASGGLPIGSTIAGEAGVTLKVRVQAPNWMDVDRVQILVSGRQPKQLNFTRKQHPKMFRDGVLRFDEVIPVPLQRDEHLIVVATAENANLEKGWGRSPLSRMPPVAFTNPIYVDVDRNGFRANGDTLGHPLMTAAAQPD
jgi:hypothetical protein